MQKSHWREHFTSHTSSSTSLRRCRTLDMNVTAEWTEGAEQAWLSGSGEVLTCSCVWATCLSFTIEKQCCDSGGSSRALSRGSVGIRFCATRLISSWNWKVMIHTLSRTERTTITDGTVPVVLHAWARHSIFKPRRSNSKARSGTPCHY